MKGRGYYIGAALVLVITAIFYLIVDDSAQEKGAVAISKKVTITLPQSGSESKAEPKEAPTKKEAAVKAAKEDFKKVVSEVKKTPEVAKKKAAPKKSTPKTGIGSLPSPKGKYWVINLASFNRLSDANRLRDRLRNAGESAYTTPFIKDGVEWSRVRVGFFATKEEAKRVGTILGKKFRLKSYWIAVPSGSEIKGYLDEHR